MRASAWPHPGITVTNVGMKDLRRQEPQFSVQGSDLAELGKAAVAPDHRQAARDPGPHVDLDTTLKPDKPTIAIDVRRDAASDLGRTST